jgi:hypothetical protein
MASSLDWSVEQIFDDRLALKRYQDAQYTGYISLNIAVYHLCDGLICDIEYFEPGMQDLSPCPNTIDFRDGF